MKILPQGSILHIMFELNGKPLLIDSVSEWEWEVEHLINLPININMNYIIAKFPKEDMCIMFDSHDVTTL